MTFGDSTLQLPVVGGHEALWAAFGDDAFAPVAEVIDDRDSTGRGRAPRRRARLLTTRSRPDAVGARRAGWTPSPT